MLCANCPQRSAKPQEDQVSRGACEGFLVAASSLEGVWGGGEGQKGTR